MTDPGADRASDGEAGTDSAPAADKTSTTSQTKAATPNPEPAEGPRDPEYTSGDNPATNDDRSGDGS
jgi:hypothetical protein